MTFSLCVCMCVFEIYKTVPLAFLNGDDCARARSEAAASSVSAGEGDSSLSPVVLSCVLCLLLARSCLFTELSVTCGL